MIKKPAVKKHWLFFVSGVIWSLVGIVLIRIAFRWIPHFLLHEKILSIAIGILLGLSIAFWGFSIIVRKNIKRINAYKDAVCIFAFQAWKSYLLIVVMMSMGIFLRNTTLIPRQLIAPMYVGIGLALFIDSFMYYKYFFRNQY